MKTITDLPPELLPNVLKYLPVYSQRQCLAVSRWWCEAVRPYLPTQANKLDLYGYGGIRNAFTEVQANPGYGRRIRRLNFFMQTGTGRPVTRDELVAILNGCPNLAELDFVDVNPFYYLMYMVEEQVPLPKLEFVRIGNDDHLASLGHRFVDFSFHYRRTINRLKIHIDNSNFSLAVGVDSIEAYFHRFISLKHLHLTTGCPIVLDELLTACPSLQKLTLNVSATFQPMNIDIGAEADPILETIELHQRHITVELYVYLRDHCPHLEQLSILGRTRDATNTLMSVFERFHDDDTLHLTNIGFKNGFDVSAQLLNDLHAYFPDTRQVEFKNCDFGAITDGNRNMLLDFNDMHLDYLSIDLAPIIDRRGSVGKVALEIISGDKTTWYQRDGKAKARADFQLKDRKSYTKNEAKQKRLEAANMSVITIQAEYVNNIRLHVTNRASTLNQLIHLEDDEEDEEMVSE